jgi:hypothetical protein
MQLDSARELKAQVFERHLAPLKGDPSVVRALGVPAQSLRANERPQRTAAVGVARAGDGDYRLALRLQQPAMERLLDLDAIRNEAKGEVDVKYIGRVWKREAPTAQETPQSLQVQRRPLVIGCSIGHFAVTAGTLGAFVTPTLGGDARILSNNHVLANENLADLADDVVQPGTIDGGTPPDDLVGLLDNFVPIDFSGTPNAVDAAVCTVAEGIGFDASTLGSFGALQGVGDLFSTTTVAKVGRTTGETQGEITAFELDGVAVQYDQGVAVFDDTIEIASQTGEFSDGGDSGSLIVSDPDLMAVGLLFAGSSTGGPFGTGVTFANPLDAVLSETGMQLVT